MLNLPPVPSDWQGTVEGWRKHAERTMLQAARARALRARLARTDPNVFMRFVLRDERLNTPLEQAPIHRRWHEVLNKHDRAIIWSHVEAGKALALDTPIPTPTGFTPMGELRDGDLVLDGDGRPCRVVRAHPVRTNRECFVVRFDDGAELVADAEHNWLAFSLDDLNARGSGEPRVVTTAQMAARVKRGRDFMWKVPMALPAQHDERPALPVPPYVLGAWLGDGNTDSSELTFHENDAAVWERCRDLVGSAPPRPDKRNPRVLSATLGPASTSRSADGLRAALRALGVLGNKHIPLDYLTAGEAQRRELLAGLLDTDGSVETARGRKSRVEFCSSRLELALGVLQLARSLGFKARMSSGASKLRGREVGQRHRVTFTAGERVFRLERKQALLRNDGEMPRTKTVVSVEPAPSVPVRCITVDSPNSTFLAGRGYTVTHNTSQIAVGRTLWELGRDPSLRIAVLSNTTDLAKKMTRQVGTYIAKSPELREVFPHLMPARDPSLPWKAQALTIERPGAAAKDPSIQATGVHGNIIGSRIDLLIADDILDFENTSTPGQREDVYRWLLSIMGRMTERGRVWLIGNVWHPEDPLHQAERAGNFKALRFPVVDAEGALTWPERWSHARIQRSRNDLGPHEFARQLLCQARDDSNARFKREWVDAAIAAGSKLRVVRSLAEAHGLPEDAPPENEEAQRAEVLWRLTGKASVFTGVDLGVQKHSSADLTAIVTILVDDTGRRRVLSVRSGRWAGPDIIDQVEAEHRRFNSIVVVENNAAQDYIVQFLRHRGSIPVVPFTTGRNKAHPEFGVEGLAVEMSNGRWVIPSEGGMDEEVHEMVKELIFFDPGEHTGDRLMALWFAREGARKYADRTVQNTVGVRVI